MQTKFDKQAAEIQAEQVALRTSIEAAKALASDADTLLKRRETPSPLVNTSTADS